MRNDKPFVPFGDFVKSLRKGRVRNSLFTMASRSASDSQVEVMRNYLVHYYKKLEAVNSFVDQEGQVWDCIPVDMQLSAKEAKKRAIKPGVAYPGDRDEKPAELPFATILSRDKEDEHGNRMYCPEGHIPLRRITIEELAAYDRIENFFNKGPVQLSNYMRAGSSLELRDNNRHEYVVGRQIVPNFGGESILNLWQPPVSNSQIFSLSQLWVGAGEGAQTQTVEAGWIVYPSHFRTMKAVLFVYWTPDGYCTCNYNKEVSNTFYQTNNNILLGGAFGSSSTMDGPQVDMRFTWHFAQNCWWLFLNKIEIGCYPGSLFGEGPLSRVADRFLVGGEVAGRSTLPVMGSGRFPVDGYQRAAYVRNCMYVKPGQGLVPMEMELHSSAGNCYSYQDKRMDGWDSQFFYGGPGGNC